MTDTNNERDELFDNLEEYALDWQAEEPNRIQMLDDWAFCEAGQHWNPLDVVERLYEGRPTLTINRLPQYKRQVLGDLRNMKPSIRVLAQGGGADVEKAKTFNGLVRNIETRSRIFQPYTTAAAGAIVGGIGHFRILSEYPRNNPFHQELILKSIHDPGAVIWDRDAREITRADAQRCWVGQDMSLQAFEKEYPDAIAVSFDEISSQSLYTYGWRTYDSVRVCELFEVVEGKAVFAKLSNGSVIRLDKVPSLMQVNEVDGIVTLATGRELQIVEKAEGKTRKVTWKKMSGAEVLDRGEWLTGDIPIIPIIGEEAHFDGTTVRKGLIRPAKEPNQQYNFWRSSQTEFIGSMPKMPYILGTSQMRGFEKIWAEANKGNKAFLPYDDSMNPHRPTRETPPQLSTGMQNEIALSAEDMKAVTGIYDAGLGNRSNEVSGRAIRQRQMESDVSTNFFGDNMQASMGRAGRILIDAIQASYDAERIERIIHEDDSDELVNLNEMAIKDGLPLMLNDMTIGDYDVVVNIGPSYATKRQEALEGMRDLLQGNPQAPMFLDIVAKHSDWPGADEFEKRAKKLMPPGVADDDDDGEMTPERQAQMQAQQQAQQLQQQQQRVEMAEAASKLAERQAKAEKTLAEADGQELENAEAKLRLAAMSGDLQSVVKAIVREALAEGRGGQPPGPPQPQPVQPGPSSEGFFNAQ